MNKPVNLSLRRKSASRLAAVQCLYQQQIAPKADLAKVIADFQLQFKEGVVGDEEEETLEIAPHWGYFEKLLRGAQERAAEVDSVIAGLLPANEKDRLNPILKAILTAALCEMRVMGLHPSIIIDEYVTLTGDFFEEGQQGFINGLLQEAANRAGHPPA